MTRIVAFYSKDGNCKALAKVLADRFGCGLFELKEKKGRKNNFLGFMNCGRQAFFGLKSKLEAGTKDKLEGYDEIVLVSPVWAGRLTPAINTILHGDYLDGKKVTMFACQASPDFSALNRIKSKFKKLLHEKDAVYNKCYCVQGSQPGKKPFSYERFAGFIEVLLKDRSI